MAPRIAPHTTSLRALFTASKVDCSNDVAGRGRDGAVEFLVPHLVLIHVARRGALAERVLDRGELRARCPQRRQCGDLRLHHLARLDDFARPREWDHCRHAAGFGDLPGTRESAAADVAPQLSLGLELIERLPDRVPRGAELCREAALGGQAPARCGRRIQIRFESLFKRLHIEASPSLAA